MSGVNNRHNLDNISRPKDGQIALPKGLSADMTQISKTENFHAIQRLLERAENQNDRINDQAMEHFFNDILRKLTTKEELNQAIDVTKQFAQHPEALSEHAQQLIFDIAQKIASHRNADYSTAKKKVKKLFTKQPNVYRNFPMPRRANFSKQSTFLATWNAIQNGM
jgi:hypothetical protein